MQQHCADDLRHRFARESQEHYKPFPLPANLFEIDVSAKLERSGSSILKQSLTKSNINFANIGKMREKVPKQRLNTHAAS